MWNLEQCFKTNNFEPDSVVESSLKFSTTAIECFADGKGFCCGSIEGRCAVNNMDFTKGDRGKVANFCFKCHRVEEPTNKTEANVFSVNGFAFNKRYNTFCSYGSDGLITTWNKDRKAKYRMSPF